MQWCLRDTRLPVRIFVFIYVAVGPGMGKKKGAPPRKDVKCSLLIGGGKLKIVALDSFTSLAAAVGSRQPVHTTLDSSCLLEAFSLTELLQVLTLTPLAAPARSIFLSLDSISFSDLVCVRTSLDFDLTTDFGLCFARRGLLQWPWLGASRNGSFGIVTGSKQQSGTASFGSTCAAWCRRASCRQNPEV